MRKILFIVNPVAGTKKGDIKKNIIKVFGQTTIHFDICFSEYVGHAYKLASDAILSGYNSIIAVGGDGTVNEVSRALVNSDCNFGIIPTGSGNGLARALKIPTNNDRALQLIIKNETHLIDTCTFNDRHFINVAGLGFDAHIAKLFSLSKKRGFFSYIKLVLNELVKINEEEICINVDNEVVKSKIIQIVFANSTQFGNNAHIAPEAKLNDQLIDVVLLNKFPIYKSLLLAFRLFKGTIHKSKYVKTYQANKVTISQSVGFNAHIDGEPIEISKPITIKIIPLSLKVIY